MFVRWQKRRAKGWHLLRASLVESTRRDGLPCQTHLAYLVSIRVFEDGMHLRPAVRFWDEALARLDELALSAADRRKVEADLARRVPRPTAAQRKAAEREFEEYRAKMTQAF